MTDPNANLWISESHVNETQGYQLGDTEPYETFTASKKRLFRSLQREYGRCVSSVYCELGNGDTKRIGWVFSKRREYEDSGRRGRKPEFYNHEVWVSLHDGLPKRTVEYQYHELEARQ